MGAWNSGSFENDDALDWAGPFSDEPSHKLIEAALKDVTEIGDEYLEAPESSKALAAAEVVAALRTATYLKLPESLRDAVIGSGIAVDSEILNLAIKAVHRVKTESELLDLWDEDDASEWLAVVNDLEARLKA